MNRELPDSGNKRAAPRHKINLRSSVLVTAMKTTDEAECIALQGQLLDVSISGLALIVSAEDIAELNRLGSEIKLQMLLPLPGGAIEVEAVPARYQKLDENGSRILIGAQITNISWRDRILFINFIHGL